MFATPRPGERVRWDVTSTTQSGNAFHPGRGFTCDVRTKVGVAPGRNWDLVPERIKSLPVPYEDHLATWRISWRSEGEEIVCTPQNPVALAFLEPGMEKRLAHTEPLRFALALSVSNLAARLVPPPAAAAAWSLYLVLEPKGPPANATPARQLEFSLQSEGAAAPTPIVKAPNAQGLAILIATGNGPSATASKIPGDRWLLAFGGANFAGDWKADLRLGTGTAHDDLARTMTSAELTTLAAQPALLAPLEFKIDVTSPRLSSRPLPVLVGLLRKLGNDERLAAYGPEPTLWLPDVAGPEANKVTWIHRGQFLDAVPFDHLNFQYRIVLLHPSGAIEPQPPVSTEWKFGPPGSYSFRRLVSHFSQQGTLVVSTDFTSSAQRPALVATSANAIQRYEHGALIHTHTLRDNIISGLRVDPAPLGNFTLHVTVCYLSGDSLTKPSFAIQFLRSGLTQLFALWGDPNTKRCHLSACKAGVWQQLAYITIPLWATGTSFNVVITHSNRDLNIWIDGVKAFSQTIDATPSGEIFLGAQGIATISYTNLVIAKLF